MYNEHYTQHPYLKYFVKCFWQLDNDYRLRGCEERLWPEGNPELIIHYGNSFTPDTDDDSVLKTAFFIGTLSSYRTIYASGKVKLYAVRFQSYGWHRLFGDLACNFVDRFINLEDLWGQTVMELEERIAFASFPQFIGVMEGFLMKRLSSLTLEYDPIIHASKVIIKDKGKSSYHSLLKSIPSSERNLERKFKVTIGYSPKKFYRIVRFNAAREVLLHNPELDVMTVAEQFNYYDYSHFTMEFKEGFGMSPKAFQNLILQNNFQQ